MEALNFAFRLKGFIESQGLSFSQFADTCGIPRPSLSQILSGRNKKISDVIVGQIHKAFPKLSVVWLLFGEGSMLTDQTTSSNNTTENVNLFSDEPEFTDGDADLEFDSNVKALNHHANRVSIPDNKANNYELKIEGLQRQIDNLRQNPRKVSHITVYYDDSTFETFYPKN